MFFNTDSHSRSVDILALADSLLRGRKDVHPAREDAPASVLPLSHEELQPYDRIREEHEKQNAIQTSLSAWP